MSGMRLTAIAIMTALAAASCFADNGKKPLATANQKAQHRWAREPTQFMGINVDGSESNLCHTAGAGGSPCLVQGQLFDLPDLGFWFEGTGMEFESKVAYLSFTFDHSYAARMAGLLIERFGPPTSKQTRIVTSAMGVRVGDTQYEWRGSKVDIVFKEHDDNLSKGSVLVTGIPVWDAYQADYLKRNGNPVDHL